ncbi:MAG: ferrochelatase [Candidatus Nanopelagicales bacterium]
MSDAVSGMVSDVTREPEPYDAVLLVSFGGPEGPDDVVPFLENVTRGRGIPRERLVEVGAHYDSFGGVSPINGQNRELVAAVERDLARRGLDLPVYWGNRNWHPLLPEAIRRMRDDGVRRALALVTSAYASYSGCRQYRENLAAALAEVAADDTGGQLPVIDKIRHYFDHPGFIEPMVDNVLDALRRLQADHGVGAEGVRLVFTTHSIPVASAATSGPPGWYDPEAGGAYVAQHRAVAELVAGSVAATTGVGHEWDLVYQSRSGPPSVPWLEPDVSDHLAALVEAGVPGAVLVPIGFISDHMEVVWDLDTVALGDAVRLGLPCVRAATVGTDPRFVAAVGELVEERLRGWPARALSPLGPSYDVCPAGCCANPRGPRPAVAGSDG